MQQHLRSANFFSCLQQVPASPCRFETKGAIAARQPPILDATASASASASARVSIADGFVHVFPSASPAGNARPVYGQPLKE